MTQVDRIWEVNTWGLRFTMAPEISYIADALLEGFRGKPNQLPIVVTPNVDILVTLESAKERVVETVDQAAMVLPDGQPLVSFSRFAGGRIEKRLAGSDLTMELWPRLVSEQRSVFAVTSTTEVAERLVTQESSVTALVAPVLPAVDGTLIDRFAWECIESISNMATVPEFIFLGIGFPKDVLLARSIVDQWPSEFGEPPMVIAVGASLEFLTGLKRRAPEVYQRLGIEFVHRIISDPKRMLKRYFVRDLRFVLILGRHLFK